MSELDPPISIAVIDDHQMFVDAIVAALEHESDLEVAGSAGTVSAAVPLVLNSTPKVVLCDQLLPDGDGIEVIEACRAGGSDAAFVLVTQVADENVIARAVEAGCSGYITKDKPLQDVVDAARSAAAGEALISPTMLARLLRRYRRGARGDDVGLTSREQEILDLLAQGLTNDAIAAQLVVSRTTVRNHVQSILTKLGAHSKLEAVIVAMQRGLVAVPPRSSS